MTLWTIIDVDALWRTAWTAALAGIGICVVFTMAVLGGTRSSDMRRADRALAASMYGVLALAGVVATLASVGYGVVLITTK